MQKGHCWQLELNAAIALSQSPTFTIAGGCFEDAVSLMAVYTRFLGPMSENLKRMRKPYYPFKHVVGRG